MTRSGRPLECGLEFTTPSVLKLLLRVGDLEGTQLLAGEHRRNAVVVEPFPAGDISASVFLFVSMIRFHVALSFRAC